MDAFEQTVANILRAEGYWVEECFKVELSPSEKTKIGCPTSPRWEIDLVAYRGHRNELLIVECKSYLDSRGVVFGSFTGAFPRGAKRFKIFNDATLRKVVTRALERQVTTTGRCPKNVKIQLCLAAGRIASEAQRTQLQKHFRMNRWQLWDSVWLESKLRELSKRGYANDVASVVSKLLLRGKVN